MRNSTALTIRLEMAAKKGWTAKTSLPRRPPRWERRALTAVLSWFRPQGAPGSPESLPELADPLRWEAGRP